MNYSSLLDQFKQWKAQAWIALRYTATPQLSSNPFRARLKSYVIVEDSSKQIVSYINIIRSAESDMTIAGELSVIWGVKVNNVTLRPTVTSNFMQRALSKENKLALNFWNSLHCIANIYLFQITLYIMQKNSLKLKVIKKKFQKRVFLIFE